MPRKPLQCSLTETGCIVQAALFPLDQRQAVQSRAIGGVLRGDSGQRLLQQILCLIQPPSQPTGARQVELDDIVFGPLYLAGVLQALKRLSECIGRLFVTAESAIKAPQLVKQGDPGFPVPVSSACPAEGLWF